MNKEVPPTILIQNIGAKNGVKNDAGTNKTEQATAYNIPISSSQIDCIRSNC